MEQIRVDEKISLDSKPKNQPLLINKALSTLVAMGVKNRPKTRAKLENALNVPLCAKVTPYINPFDALDIASKLSDTDIQSIRIQNGIKHIYASKSEIDKRVWELAGAATSTAISGKTIAIPTEQISRKYYEKITQRMCSWLSSNPEGEKQKLLDELATRAILEDECQPQEVVDNLMEHGIIQVNGEDVVYSFPPDARIKAAKGILKSQLVNDEMTLYPSSSYFMLNDLGVYIYSNSEHFHLNCNDHDSNEFPIGADIPVLRALLILYEMPEIRRPNKMSELLKELSHVCRLTYVVQPNHIFENEQYKKYVRVQEVKTSRRKRKTADSEKVAIGKNGLRVEEIQLTPTSLLASKEEKPIETPEEDKPNPRSRSQSPVIEKMICQRALQRSQAKAERKESMRRRKAVTRGKSICQTFMKTANFIAQKRSSTLVEANREEKIEMIKNVENWIASFQDKMDIAEESQLPSLKDICQQLCGLCIGKVRTAAPSSLVLQLQKTGCLTISESSPHRVTYNLPITRKNAPWAKDAEQVIKKTRMFYLPYLKPCYLTNLMRSLYLVKENDLNDVIVLSAWTTYRHRGGEGNGSDKIPETVSVPNHTHCDKN